MHKLLIRIALRLLATLLRRRGWHASALFDPPRTRRPDARWRQAPAPLLTRPRRTLLLPAPVPVRTGEPSRRRLP